MCLRSIFLKSQKCLETRKGGALVEVKGGREMEIGEREKTRRRN
jgi:hypothetical protein